MLWFNWYDLKRTQVFATKHNHSNRFFIYHCECKTLWDFVMWRTHWSKRQCLWRSWRKMNDHPCTLPVLGWRLSVLHFPVLTPSHPMDHQNQCHSKVKDMWMGFVIARDTSKGFFKCRRHVNGSFLKVRNLWAGFFLIVRDTRTSYIFSKVGNKRSRFFQKLIKKFKSEFFQSQRNI